MFGQAEQKIPKIFLNNYLSRIVPPDVKDKINFLKDYSSFKREYEESASTWDLLHRLDEIRDYISCVEAIDSCLKDARLNSKGLNNLLEL